MEGRRAVLQLSPEFVQAFTSLKPTNMGFAKSQARTTQVSRLSARPLAAFARELADSGASSSTSAQRRNSMCSTGSPTERHCLHSASSFERTGRDERKAGEKENTWREGGVGVGKEGGTSSVEAGCNGYRGIIYSMDSIICQHYSRN